MVKEWLIRHGARYELKDVRRDPAALAEMLAHGALLPPVTVVEGVPIVGYRPDELERALFGEG